MVCCCIIGCNSKDTKGAKLFRIPSIPSMNVGAYVESSVERNKRWLQNINNPDVTVDTYQKHRVCENHFIKGKPARVQDKEDPDWAPSVNLVVKPIPSPNKKQTKDSQRLKRRIERSEKSEVNTGSSPKKIKDEKPNDVSMALPSPIQKHEKIEIQKIEELPKFVAKIEMEQEPIEYFEPYKQFGAPMDIPVGGEIEVELPKEFHIQHLPIVEQTVVVETTHREEEVVEYSPRKDATRIELEMAKRKIRELQKELDTRQTEILRKNIEILNLKKKLSISQQEVMNLQSTISIQQEQEQEEVIVEEADDDSESAVVSDINSYTTVAGKKLYYVVVNKDRFLQIPLPEGNSL